MPLCLQAKQTRNGLVDDRQNPVRPQPRQQDQRDEWRKRQHFTRFDLQVMSTPVFVDRAVYDDFVSKLVEKASKLKLGNPIEKDVYTGPVINEKSVETFEQAVQDVTAGGGKVLLGGARATDGDLDNESGIFVDGFDDEGGSTLTIGGRLTNSGAVFVGNETLSGSATLSAAA